jgi:hypothetical protein
MTRARVEQVMALYNVSRSEARRMFPTVNLEVDDTPTGMMATTTSETRRLTIAATEGRGRPDLRGR